MVSTPPIHRFFTASYPVRDCPENTGFLGVSIHRPSRLFIDSLYAWGVVVGVTPLSRSQLPPCLPMLLFVAPSLARSPTSCRMAAGCTCVNPNGSRWWRLKYRVVGREKLLSFGVYPEVTLKDARERRDDARRLLASGVDPGAKRRARRRRKLTRSKQSPGSGSRSFRRDGRRRTLTRCSGGWSCTFPAARLASIRSISAPDVLTCLRRIEERGTLETAHRTHQHCGQVFRYAVATGRADRDPCADLRGALPPAIKEHLASITDVPRVGELLRAIDGYAGTQIARCALRLAPLVFVRPGELRGAEWAEFDLPAAEWRIPEERMKARVQHIRAALTAGYRDSGRASAAHG